MAGFQMFLEQMVGGVSPLPVALLLIAASAVITGISKSGFGGSIGIVAIPLMVNAMPAQHAVGVMLPVLLLADLFALGHHRQHFHRSLLGWSLVGASAGVLLAYGLLWWFASNGTPGQSDARLNLALQWCVGVISLGMVAVQLWRMLGWHLPRVPGHPSMSMSFGALAGLTSTLAHAGGPVMSVYLLEQRLQRRILVGTMVLFFFVVNLIKLPVYFMQGLVDLDTLLFSAMLAPLVPLGSWLGLWMLRRIPEKPFAFVMYLAAAVAGARAIWQVI